MKARSLIALEISAIGLVLILRMKGWMPLPAWPILLLIAAGFGSSPWQSLQNPGTENRLPLKSIVLAATVGISYQFFTIFIEGPFLGWLYGEAETPPQVDWLVGNVAGLLGFLLLIVIFSIGEEIAYRGYLLERISRWLGNSTASALIALTISSISFGFMHTWQNLTGITGTIISGIIFGGMYLLSGSDVRVPIITHMAVNVTAVVLAFCGLFIS